MAAVAVILTSWVLCQGPRRKGEGHCDYRIALMRENGTFEFTRKGLAVTLLQGQMRVTCPMCGTPTSLVCNT